jgi:3-hydroxyisobutyrate dehydrogenase
VIGLVGCGNMGAAIASRLTAGGEVVAFDLDRARLESLVARAPVGAASALVDVAGGATAVVLSLPNAAASAAVVEQLKTHLAPGAVVIETSTVAPGDVRRLAGACAPQGVHVVDAAILSGVAQMEAGTSMLLVGGDGDAVEAAKPVLDLLAPRRLRLGPVGAGMAAKVANNAVSHAVMVVLLEATATAAAAGVPPGVFAELLEDPDAGLLRPLTHRLRERVFRGDYAGGMPTEAARKDSRLALELAQEGGVPLFAIQAAHTPYELAVAAGLGRDDYAALARLWEEWTGRALRPNGGA